MVSALWDSESYGNGKVFSGMTLDEALQTARILPDVHGEKLYFAHRETNDCDIYFLNNHTDSILSGLYTFKTKYQYAQLWDAVSGKRYRLSADKGLVTLHLSPRESCFVVFSNNNEQLDDKPLLGKRHIINSTWTIDFNCPYQRVGQMECRELEYWNKSENSKIRYYSGTAVYKTSFEWEDAKSAVFLQLPSNNCVTEVYINKQKAGIIWCSPWSLDVSPYLKKGKNELRLEVTNSWNNRAVGDLRLKQDKIIWKPELFVSENSLLQDAGLQGDIMLAF